MERREYFDSGVDHDTDYGDRFSSRRRVESGEGNLISSSVAGSFMHAPVIDLDWPCRLVPSSTPGHFHLYIDCEVNSGAYFDMLDAMARAGVVEEGYANVSRERGASFVRKPQFPKGYFARKPTCPCGSTELRYDHFDDTWGCLVCGLDGLLPIAVTEFPSVGDIFQDGIFPHECVEMGCTYIVEFDDEPWCFTHSPDEGSALAGYSARAEANKKEQF